MRLWFRSVLLVLVGGSLGVAFVFPAALSSRWHIPAFLWLVGWVAAMEIVAYLILRGPHCGRYAVVRASGWRRPLVGSRCSYCGREF